MCVHENVIKQKQGANLQVTTTHQCGDYTPPSNHINTVTLAPVQLHDCYMRNVHIRRYYCCGAGFGGEDDREMEQSGRLPPNTGIEGRNLQITPKVTDPLVDCGRQYFDGVG